MYINKTRLRVLQCRQELLDELFEEATVQLASILDDTNSYAGLLEKLTLQVNFCLFFVVYFFHLYLVFIVSHGYGCHYQMSPARSDSSCSCH